MLKLRIEAQEVVGKTGGHFSECLRQTKHQPKVTKMVSTMFSWDSSFPEDMNKSVTPSWWQTLFTLKTLQRGIECHAGF